MKWHFKEYDNAPFLYDFGTPDFLAFQFFICHDKRRTGYGKQAFQTLLTNLNIQEIEIDVYVWNKSRVAFGESLGFEKRCYNMSYKQ